ncbi:MAG: S49 family peptidase [Nitrospirae bacterium]|nr:S49 family peptidase [Nitrospirota bacterium]
MVPTDTPHHGTTVIHSLLYGIRTLLWLVARAASLRARAPDYVVFTLSGPLPLVAPPRRWGRSPFGPCEGSLHGLAEACRRIATDPRIAGVVFNLRTHLSPAAADGLREVFQGLGAAGKRVVVYAAELDTQGVRIAAAAHRVVLQEGGRVGPLGVARAFLFLADALGRVGVRAQVVPSGPYKWPGTFDRTDLPEPVRENMEALLDADQAALVDALVAGRGKTPAGVGALIDQGLLTDLEAQAEGLVDELAAEEQLPALLGTPRHPARLATWARARRGLRRPPPPRPGRYVALIRVQGYIVSGRSQTPPLVPPLPMLFAPRAGDLSVVQAARRVLADRRAAACVLWIDSPGGSATASEAMYQALAALGAHKPVVAAMGNVAASGGYYVAAAAHWVVARPGTLTGSIGALWTKFTIGDFFTRVSLHRQVLSRGRHATMHDAARPYTEEQLRMVERGVARVYEVFRARVAAGRKLTPEAVDGVGQGRVFRGAQALDARLVDALGGLDAAVAKARELSGLPPDAPLLEVGAGRRGLPPPRAGATPAALYAAESVALLGREGCHALCPLWTDPPE